MEREGPLASVEGTPARQRGQRLRIGTGVPHGLGSEGVEVGSGDRREVVVPVGPLPVAPKDVLTQRVEHDQNDVTDFPAVWASALWHCEISPWWWGCGGH